MSRHDRRATKPIVLRRRRIDLGRTSGTAGLRVESQQQFNSARYFPALQQVRTLSVLAVITVHMQDRVWSWFKGDLGVQVFFVLSGFLITTLLLREELAFGRVAIGRFYIRRAFRLLPVYFLVLAAFSVIILGAGLGGQVADFRNNLIYFVTYQNEFASEAPFGHSWSLAIEEKFYLAMPVLLFGLSIIRARRLQVLAILLLVTVAMQFTPAFYGAIFVPLVAGSLIGVALASTDGFRWLWRISAPGWGLLFLALGIALSYLLPQPPRVYAWASICFALCLPSVVLARGAWLRILTLRPLVWAGTFTYTAYLIHPICKSLIDEVVPNGQTALLPALLRLMPTVALVLGASMIIYRFYERPFQRLGQRLARSRRPEFTVPAVPGRP